LPVQLGAEPDAAEGQISMGCPARVGLLRRRACVHSSLARGGGAGSPGGRRGAHEPVKIARSPFDCVSIEEGVRFASSKRGAALARHRRGALMLEIAARIGLPPTPESLHGVARALEQRRGPEAVTGSSAAVEQLPPKADEILTGALATLG